MRIETFITPRKPPPHGEREFVIDNLLVRIHFIIVIIRWTGLAPWELSSGHTFSKPSPCLIPSRNRPV